MLLAFFGFFNVYALRVNLSVAIVAMTDIRTIEHENGTTSFVQDFDYSSKQKGLVLSSFFYGYITTQFVGGYLGMRFGGNVVFGLGIAVTALLTLLTPIAAKTNFYLLLTVRIIEGIFEGVTYPCIHAVWSKWAPPFERSRMAGFALAGSYAGTVIAMPLSGVFAVNFGWESVFYIFGALGLVWFAFWVTIVKASPDDDRNMPQRERDYINESLGNQRNHQPKFSDVPWMSIVSSLPVWAIITSHFCESWGFFTLLTELPTFLKGSATSHELEV